MDKIITDLYEIMKHSLNPIDTEKEIQNYMWQTFSEIMGEFSKKLIKPLKKISKLKVGKFSEMIYE